MKEEKDYIQDIAEIRSMMERSSKFLSLSGWAGIMAGIYGLAGAYIAYNVYDFNPGESGYSGTGSFSSGMPEIIILAITVLALALITAVYISFREANKRGEKLWNSTSKRLSVSMAVPFLTGGILILILISKGLMVLAAPFSLIFYGLALYNAGRYTYQEVRTLGCVQIFLGLTATYFVSYGLLIWALGFGVAHIIYGIYMHYRYEK